MEREARRQAGVEEAAKGVWSLMDLVYISALQLLTRTLLAVPIPSRVPGRSMKCWAQEPAQWRLSAEQATRKTPALAAGAPHLPSQALGRVRPGTRIQVNHL